MGNYVERTLNLLGTALQINSKEPDITIISCVFHGLENEFKNFEYSYHESLMDNDNKCKINEIGVSIHNKLFECNKMLAIYNQNQNQKHDTLMENQHKLQVSKDYKKRQ